MISSSDEYENNNLNPESELIIKRYQEDVEDVLTWILGAEEKLNNNEQQDKNEESLETIQQIVQSLEDFTIGSSDRQKKIKDILREGQLLMRSILNSEDDVKEIQIQRDLLSGKWEELKNMIMDKQERLHNTLMSLQKKQLNDFSNWLKTVEDKISAFNEIETNLELVNEQYKEHMQFQNELVREHEPMVKTLNDMYIIIDECENPNLSSENLTEDLVDQIEALAEKWNNVCTIIEEREATLNIWKMLLEQEDKFNKRVMKIVKRLQEIETAASEGASGITFLSNLISRLDRMKKEVNVQLIYYSEMFNQAQVQLRRISKDSQAAIRIKEKIDILSKQWNSIMDKMNMLSDSIRKMYDVQNEQTKLERKSSMRAKNNSSDDKSRSAKRLKLDKWKLEEWQKSISAFLESLRKYEERLGIELEKTNDSNNQKQAAAAEDSNLIIKLDDLDLKEQELLIDETQDEFEVKECDYQSLVQQGTFLIEELKKLEEDTLNLDELLEIMKRKWKQCNDALSEKQLKISAYLNLVKLASECDAIRPEINLNNERLDTERSMIKKLNTKQNFNEINKMYDQYKLQLKVLLAQTNHIKTIEDEYKEILKQFPTLSRDKTAVSLKMFLDYWQETIRKIAEYQQDVENKLRLGKKVKEKAEKLSETYPKLVNAIDVLEKWLIRTYQIVYAAQLALYWRSDEYEEQLKSFKELEEDINNEKENLDYINATGNKVIKQHSDADWIPSFKNKIKDFKS